MTWLYMYVMGFFFIGYTYKFNRELLRIQWKTLALWTAFVVVTGIGKYYLFDYLPMSDLVDPQAIASVPWWGMILAGFEEAMFTLPIYYCYRYIDNKWLRRLAVGAMAGVFAFGHIYQGMFAIVPTFLYMSYVAPSWMKNVGFGTMVLGHIIFDVSMWVMIQFLINPNLLENLIAYL